MLSFFSLQNAVCFIILTYLVPVLFTFYLQAVLKLRKNNSCAKMLINKNFTFAAREFASVSLCKLLYFGCEVCVSALNIIY